MSVSVKNGLVLKKETGRRERAVRAAMAAIRLGE
jgi:hypothetical protein|tara:strand:- start:679 stop:780 length:102 start_codon:yes stop_codon:yes gene_type:complete